MGWSALADRRVIAPVRGRFITLEGGEGVGKSTQAARIAAALRERGLKIVVTREPGGTAGAEAIRTLLLSGAADRWSARAEMLLFAAARTDHVERVIAPALARGDWVICDRYIDSTRAYQGSDQLNDDDVMRLHEMGGRLMPDRTLLFRLGLDAASARVDRRDQGQQDRFGARQPEFHAAIAARFAALASREPDRIRSIDASMPAEQVTDAALSELADLA